MASINRCLGFVLAVAMLGAAGLSPAWLGAGAEAQAQGLDQKGVRPPAGKGAAPDAGAAGSAQDAGLRQRVEQLEEQLVDLQVVIGTLESLARQGPVAAAPTQSEGSGGLGSSDKARLDGLETQLRALTAQLEALASEMRGGQRRSDTGLDATGAPPPPSFGSTTVTAGTDPIGSVIAEQGPSSAGPGAGPGAAAAASASAETKAAGLGTQTALAPPPAANAQQAYNQAYGYLLQRDYGTAQAAFGDFLKRYPQDAQAPNALYWLGETHYVQRNYADAAEAFDLVTSSYGQSNKAPDAQLKRAMSLAQLGRRQEACTAFRGVSTKFPRASANVKSLAESEMGRVGCP